MSRIVKAILFRVLNSSRVDATHHRVVAVARSAGTPMATKIPAVDEPSATSEPTASGPRPAGPVFRRLPELSPYQTMARLKFRSLPTSRHYHGITSIKPHRGRDRAVGFYRSLAARRNI
jgi:hypothetical protein